MSEELRYKPPDGGWGWIIVLSTFMMNFIVFGILNVSGVLFVEILEDLNTGKGQTAWISSLAFGTLMATSPLSSALSSHYGNRCISIIGSVIAAAGFVAGSFVWNIHFLYLTHGFIAGFGFGLTYLPFLVCVGNYFEARRSLAVGLSVCGTGAGTIVMAPIVKILIDVYGWRGSTLIIGGIALHIAIFGSLLRPLKPVKCDQLLNLDGKTTDKNGVDSFQIEKHSDSRNRQDRSDNLHKEINDEMFESHTLISKKESNTTTWGITNIDKVQDVDKKDIKHSETEARICNVWLEFFIKHFDFSLLKNTTFLTFMLSNFSVVLGFNAPYIYLPDRSKEVGISKTDSAFFISVIGISNTVGRVVFGWLGDRKWMKRHLLYSVTLFIAGAINLLNPLNDSKQYLLFYSSVYGLFGGGFCCLYVVVLIDLIGLEKLSNGLGIVILAQGMASYIGPPVAGWLYDVTHSYDTSFYFIGVVLIIGGLLLWFIVVKNRLDSSNEANN